VESVRILLRSNERVFLCGKTGSGKTYAAHKICRKLRRLVVLDPKARIDSEEWNLRPWDREARTLLANGEPIRTLVRAPIGPGAEEEWDRAYLAVLNAGNATLYIDEVYGVIEGRPSPYLVAIWTRGRELGIGAYAASQRPAWVPIVMMSEAEHFFIFRLTVGDDRRRVAEFLGPDAMEVIRDEHGFLYSRAEWDAPAYFPELPPEVAERKNGKEKVNAGAA
jgi:hypothetical protein